ncbi:tannase and feruloyl esterase-domain-containing protein [Mycena haematopus]|nr:tannase and feruloyl esterase-domain-containing protein [Mycena haematopus]
MHTIQRGQALLSVHGAAGCRLPRRGPTSLIPPAATAPMWPTKTGLSFCNVTLSYGHINLQDSVRFLPAARSTWVLCSFFLLSSRSNRFSTSSGYPTSHSTRTGTSRPGAVAGLSAARTRYPLLSYGAVSGATDGGFGGFGTSLTPAILQAGGNDTIAWPPMQSYAYLANHELTVTGKQLAMAFYNISASQLKSYYMGCSEGGREGLKAAQTYAADYDGIIAAAPGLHLPITQTIQGWPSWAMAQMGYWPSPCAFEAIQADYIAACDPLDGLKDGVVSRSDLCTYSATKSAGKAYSNCTKAGAGAPTSGTVSTRDVQVVDMLFQGPHNSAGERVWFSYQPGIDWTVEAPTVWDKTTQSFGPGLNSFFDDIYQMLVLKTTVTPVFDYANFTVDSVYLDIVALIKEFGGWTQSTWPDLSEFQARGGKLITWQGEQDNFLMTQMSADYYETVRAHMFPGSGSDYAQIHDFYRYFRVPGAGHCALNPFEPKGPFPQNVLGQLIAWVERGIAPAALNGSTESGSSTQPTICLWPAQPMWDAKGNLDCVPSTDTAQTFIHPPTAWKIGALV